MSRSRFRRTADRFIARAGDLTAEEFLVEAMRIVALPTLGGRDGHTALFPGHAGIETHFYPLRLYDFDDGIFVVDALPPYRSLVGAELIGIGRHNVARIRRELRPLVSRDNSSTVRARLPELLTTAEVLAGIGISDAARARFRLSRNGHTLARTLEPIPLSTYLDWVGGHHLAYVLPSDGSVLYLSRVHADQWSKYLPDENVLYLQYNQVVYPDRLLDALERHGDTQGLRVVVDVRHNGGGDNTQYGALVSALKGSPVDRPDSLYVVAGRATFSAAGNFVGELLHETNATLVGEPAGGSTNQFGDSQVVELPHSGITAFVAVYFVEVVPGETRALIPPDVPTGLSSHDYSAHRDPALEAILAR